MKPPRRNKPKKAGRHLLVDRIMPLRKPDSAFVAKAKALGWEVYTPDPRWWQFSK